MKKKQSKKKTQNKRKKNSSEKTAFSNLENTSNTISTSKRSSSGIPKYVADRMARRIFFTAGIPTILGMSVFVVAILSLQEILLKYLLHQQLQFQRYFSY